MTSDAPTLVISAEADPVTPPARALDVLRGLPNSTHVVLPNAGHIGNVTGCEVGIIARFLETAPGTGLDLGCARARPPRQFVLP